MVHAEYLTERLCSQDHAGPWVCDERPMEERAAVYARPKDKDHEPRHRHDQADHGGCRSVTPGRVR
jgi:hypothetical protein